MNRRPMPMPMPMPASRVRRNQITDTAAPAMPIRSGPAMPIRSGPMPAPMPAATTKQMPSPIRSGPLDNPSSPIGPSSSPISTTQQEMPVRGASMPGPISLPVDTMKKGGKVKKYAKGGSIDGCAQRGKTRGKLL